MEKRKNTKLRAIDLLVIFVCFFGIVLNIVLFWRDLNRTLTKLYEEHIATVTYKYKAAQRKFVDRVLWDRLRQEAPVYNGDIIRTADLAEARITFLDGQYIELFENTLAQIFWDKRGFLIDFGGGDININSHVGKNAFILSSGKNRVEVSAGGVLSAKGSDQTLNLMLIEGDAKFSSDGSSNLQSLSAGSALKFLQDGTQETIPMVAVISPIPGTQALNSSYEPFPVNFVWKTNNFSAGETVYLEISQDTSFKKPVYASEIRNVNQTQIEVPLSTGGYWWRMYPSAFKDADDSYKNISSGRLTIHYVPSPKLISPADKYVFSYRTSLPAVRFLWSGTERASAYRLDVADNPGMQNPKVSRQLYDTSLVLSVFETGTWYWRVTPLYPADYIGTAYAPAVSSFVINRSGTLGTPALSTPVEGYFVNIAKESKDTYFSWKNEQEAAFYTLQISKNGNLSDPVITREIKDNWFIYKPKQGFLEEGVHYYWGVYQVDQEGNNSPVSEIRSFYAMSGEIVQRALFPPDDYTIADARMPDIRFTWRTNLPFPSRFQVSTSSDFSRLEIDDEVVVTSVQGKTLAAGEYYWRIYAQSEDDEPATFITPVRHFSVVPPLPAPPPVESTPTQNEKVVVRGKNPVEFKWSAVPGANYYQLKLYREGSSEETLSQLVQKNNTSLVMDNLPDGNYRWTVQAFVDEGQKTTRRSSLLGINHFSMKKLNPVYLSPASGYAFEGLQALRSPGSVSWSTPEQVGETRFILSRTANPLTDASPSMDIKNPSKTIQLIPLKEGRWYWTIIAETIDGFDISAITPSYFTVTPIPLLPAPDGRKPENRYTIGPEQLRVTKSIIFSWNSVEGANAYIITILQEGTRANQRQLLHSATVTETKYELEDLSILDRGTFTWQVEAISKTEEDIIEQRGNVGQNSFIINLPQMNKPQAKQPGILYGKE